MYHCLSTQVCIVQCLNRVASGWSPSASAPGERAAALAESAALLAAALAVPKSSNLRREALSALQLCIR